MIRFLARSLLLLTLLSAVSGCGPIASTVGLVRAEKALRAAEEAGAEQTAVYPLELSRQLLEKAREEQGYSSYDTATQLAKEAESLAESASKTALEAGFVEPEEPPALQAIDEIDDPLEPSAEGDEDSAPRDFYEEIIEEEIGIKADEDAQREDEDKDEGSDSEDKTEDPASADEPATPGPWDAPK